MRVLFSIIGLLVVVAIVGMLVKTQLTTSTPHPSTPAIDTTTTNAPNTHLEQLQKAQNSGNPKAVQDAYKKALDETLKAQQEKLENIENSAVAE